MLCTRQRSVIHTGKQVIVPALKKFCTPQRSESTTNVQILSIPCMVQLIRSTACNLNFDHLHLKTDISNLKRNQIECLKFLEMKLTFDFQLNNNRMKNYY